MVGCFSISPCTFSRHAWRIYSQIYPVFFAALWKDPWLLRNKDANVMKRMLKTFLFIKAYVMDA